MRRLPWRVLRPRPAASSVCRHLPFRTGEGGRVEPSAAQLAAIPAEFVRWSSLGSCRGSSRFASGFTPLQPNPLASILDVERAKDLSTGHLVAAWDDYHLGRGHIGASLKAKLYHLLAQRSATWYTSLICWSILNLHEVHGCTALSFHLLCTIVIFFLFCSQHFVIPLWRGSGYTTMFMQVQMPYIIYTGLEDYKARGTQASPYYTVTHYTEFAETKDVVLIRGDVIFTSKLNDLEAKWLLETAQSFYLNDVRYKLVERFNKETREFEFKDVLKVLEMPTL